MTRNSTPHLLALAIALALSAGALGCSRPADTPREAAPAAPATTTLPAEEPKFEAAYPADVSAEGLTAKDAEQQRKVHSHDGGAPHAHDEKEKEGDHGHPH